MLYKEYQIFEMLERDVNNAINESLGISEAVSDESKRVCNALLKDISSAERKLIGDGVGYRSGIMSMVLFEDSKTVKGVDIPTVKVSFSWEHYNFRDRMYYEEYRKKHPEVYGGSSVVILNPYKRAKGKNQSGSVSIAINSISGNIDTNTLIDTMSHELRHIIDTTIPFRQFPEAELIATVKANLQNSDYEKRLIANILYLSNSHEITAYVQGFHDYIDNEKWKYGSVDKAVEHSQSYNILMSLKERTEEAQSLMDDETFMAKIDEYTKYGINRRNFVNKAEEAYKEILKRIGKAIVDVKQKFIREGLHCGMNYIHFHTSFHRYGKPYSI